MTKGIFKEYKLKNLSLRNSAVMAPMCLDMADDNGMVNEFHYIHYTNRALGGVGAIILEATAVEKRGRITAKDLGIWSDEHISGLKKVAEGIKTYGAAAGIQLGHAGRKYEPKEEKAIAPSSIAFAENYDIPIEMTEKHMEEVKTAFREGARRANEAGFDFIELHGAHGYLISEFLSPLANKRNDNYGGSIKNRTRFVVELIREVKKVWPEDKVLAIRVSADDYSDGGNTMKEMAEIVKILKAEGVDIVDVSTGAVVSGVKINTYTGYQIPHAEYIKKNSNIPVIGGGLITTAKEAAEIIENNRADLVFLGRILLREPYFILNEGKREGIDISYMPTAYTRGF